MHSLFYIFRSTKSERLADRLYRALIAALERFPIETNSTGAVASAVLEPSQEIRAEPSDAGFLREQGVPVVGFSPIRRTPPLERSHDEYLHVDAFLEGIGVCECVLKELANLV